MPDIDKIEKVKRIRFVMEWIIDDYVYQDIISQIIAKWGIGERQAKRYIADARKEWSKHAEGDLDQKRRRRVEALKKLRRSLKDNYRGTPEGIRAVVAVEKELIKLEGLELPRKVELTGKGGQPIQTQVVDEIDYDALSDEALHEILKARKKNGNSEAPDTDH